MLDYLPTVYKKSSSIKTSFTAKIEWNHVSKIHHDNMKVMKNVTFKLYIFGISATDITDYLSWEATHT